MDFNILNCSDLETKIARTAAKAGDIFSVVRIYPQSVTSDHIVNALYNRTNITYKILRVLIMNIEKFYSVISRVNVVNKYRIFYRVPNMFPACIIS